MRRIAACVGCILVLLPATTSAQSLRGSSYSLTVQNRAAREHNFSYLRTAAEIRRFVDNGYLVEVPGNEHYVLGVVSYPYARPEVKLFIERLAVQYRAACGERLVITSLVRPAGRQPHNASSRSVHPTGMAVDIRRSRSRLCQTWIEDTLLGLERSDVLEATLERRPPHYHVAIFPRPYSAYVASLEAQGYTLVELTARVRRDDVRHEVRRGESLWTIARNYGITVDDLKKANNMDGARIYTGQILMIPIQ